MGSMITTVDNPYDPRLDFKAWYAWDVAQGYNTCSYLDRVASIPESWPAGIRQMVLEQAMDEIISIHDDGLYKKLPVDQAA